jgi:hypothetical protein
MPDLQEKCAVLVLHGIGRQSPPQIPGTPTYSRSLYRNTLKALRKCLPNADNQVYWKEVHYAGLFNDIQQDYYARLGRGVKRSRLRQLMIENFGDAAAYHSAANMQPNSTFERVQACIARALKELERKVPAGTPIIVVAHSLGGKVTADYLRYRAPHHEQLVGLASLHSVVTFGCNIPLFHLGSEFEGISPPKHPGNCPKERPWWINLYDRDDVLGYPLAPTGKGYQNMAKAGELIDIEVNAGNIFTRWNTLSHMQYWSHKRVAHHLSVQITDALGFKHA